MKMPTISMNQFYKVGIFCFALGAIGNLWNLILYWVGSSFGSKLITGGNLLFNLFLIAFFIGLYKSTQIPVENKIKDEDINTYVG